MSSSSDSSDAVLRVAGVQIANVDATTPEQRDYNLKLAVDSIRESKGGFDVYVLPELSSVGYPDAASMAKTVGALSEPHDVVSGPSFKALQPVAIEMKAHIVFGFPRLGEQEQQRPTISQAVIGPDGTLVAVYDKLHVCSFGDCAESDFFDAGKHLTVFKVNGFRVGVLICYDVRFPKVWQALATDYGVDVILHPSAFPDDGSFSSWHTFVTTRALETQVYCLSVSRAGPHFGCSRAVGPIPTEATHGSAVLSRDPGLLPMIVRRSVLTRARTEFPFLKESRRDTRAILCEGAPALEIHVACRRVLMNVPKASKGPAIVKILTPEQFADFEATKTFAGAPIDHRDGYIHISSALTAVETVRLYFGDHKEVVLVGLDPLQLGADLKWDFVASRGETFPHLYRPMQWEDIVWTRRVFADSS